MAEITNKVVSVTGFLSRIFNLLLSGKNPKSIRTQSAMAHEQASRLRFFKQVPLVLNTNLILDKTGLILYKTILGIVFTILRLVFTILRPVLTIIGPVFLCYLTFYRLTGQQYFQLIERPCSHFNGRQQAAGALVASAFAGVGNRAKLACPDSAMSECGVHVGEQPASPKAT